MGLDAHALHREWDRLYWVTFKRLHGLRQGAQLSPLRGHGLDLADLRTYQPGDDVRHIDWLATARLQQPHVRLFHEDRDLTAWFIVDASASTAFGSMGRSKYATGIGYAALMARLLLRQGNRVGAIVHAGESPAVLPARGGAQQLWALTQHLTAPHVQRPAPGVATDLGHILLNTGRTLRSRSAVFVLSDFQSQPGWDIALGQLAQRHEVVAVHLVDPMDWQLPAAGPVALHDPETGERLWADWGDPQLRTRFAEQAAAEDAERVAGFTRAGVDVFELATCDDLPQAVLRQLWLRQPRGPHALTPQESRHAA